MCGNTTITATENLFCMITLLNFISRQNDSCVVLLTPQFQGNHWCFTLCLYPLHIFLRIAKHYIGRALLFRAAVRKMHYKAKFAKYKCSVLTLQSNLFGYQSASCSKIVFHSELQKFLHNHVSEVSHQASYRWHLIEHLLKSYRRNPSSKL